jgi:hypothetical protein
MAHETTTTATPEYGLMAEFPSSAALLRAAERAYREGYRRIDGFSPFPVHGLAEAMGHHDKQVQRLVLLGGIAGALAGLTLCYWTNTTEGIGGILSGYAYNVGGRPLNSWPAFIVPAFETTILFAAITAVMSMLALNGLPLPYHPVFNVKRFREHASQDGFFLVVEADDDRYDAPRTRAFLEDLGAIEVTHVDR